MDLRPCKTCGALLAGGDDWEESAAVHSAWHALLERRIEVAGRYKPEPRYGG